MTSAVKTKVVLQKASLVSKFKGALVGAVVGDCLGAYFENDRSVKLESVIKFFSKLDEKPPKNEKAVIHSFTDDTAMARSVAASLVAHRGLDRRDMAKRFSEEYFKEPGRGYGGNVATVFKALQDDEYKDPFYPASQQFDGSGSYGNGGAMRIVPAALFGYNLSEDKLESLVEDITRVTHSHQDAINGSKLQASAVQLSLKQHMQPGASLDTDKFVQVLHERMQQLEHDERPGTDSPPPKRRPKRKLEELPQPYCQKLRKIQEYLKSDDDVSSAEVVTALGNDVSALGSVPAAVYCFLRCTQPLATIECENAFERTVKYAISLGGDTDTIATMAGAMAGAYYGIDSIPPLWTRTCEGAGEALKFAEQLHEIYKLMHADH